MPRRYLDQRLKLPLLRVADALDAHGSLLKASSALGVGQPALTRSLPELRLLTHQTMLSNIALYARLGYVETDRRVEDGFARVFMAKRL